MGRPYILDVLAKKDARSFVPAKRKTCKCCGEHGEFDPFYSHVPAKAADQMRRQFGGDCCIACIEAEPVCQECGSVGDMHWPIKQSDFFNDFAVCEDCEREFEAQARRAW